MKGRFRTMLAASILLAVPLLVGAVAPQRYDLPGYLLELDGAPAGVMASLQGGNVHAEVLTEPAGPDGFGRKRLGQPQVEPFEMQVGFGMSQPVYDWMAAFLRMEVRPKDGAVVASSGLTRRAFTGAVITEITLPAMDAASKEAGYLTVKFAPEQVRYGRGSAGKSGAKAPPAPSRSAAQKQWPLANFRLEIDGLDARRVSRIDPITVRQPAMEDGAGSSRRPERAPGPVEISNLKITLSATQADDWLAWYEDFVIEGHNGPEQEKSGSISLLAANQKELLATVRLHNLGIVAVREVRNESGAASAQRYEVELYVERMELEVPRVKQ